MSNSTKLKCRRCKKIIDKGDLLTVKTNKHSTIKGCPNCLATVFEKVQVIADEN